MVLIWANTSFNAEQREIGDYYEKNSNMMKEMIMIEDVWLSKNPADYVNVTLRNVGDIALKVKEVKVTALNSAGLLACPGPSPLCSKTVTVNSVIPSNCSDPKDCSIKVVTSGIDWDNAASTTLDISVTTERGTIKSVIWKVT
jgi:hypothetical protein